MRAIPWLLLACACHKAPTCEQVWDHIVSLAPDEMRAGFAAKRDREVVACEHDLTDDQKRCVVAAANLEALGKCTPSNPAVAVAAPPPRSRANDTSDVRDVVARFGANQALRGTRVELNGYAVSITNDIPFTKHGVRIYPITICDHVDPDDHVVTLSCVATSPVAGIVEGDRVHVAGALGGDPMEDPESAQVQLDDCTVGPASP